MEILNTISAFLILRCFLKKCSDLFPHKISSDFEYFGGILVALLQHWYVHVIVHGITMYFSFNCMWILLSLPKKMQNWDKVFFLIFQTLSKNKFIHVACIRDYTVNLKLYLSDYLPIMEIESGYQSNVITLAMYQALY